MNASRRIGLGIAKQREQTRHLRSWAEDAARMETQHVIAIRWQRGEIDPAHVSKIALRQRAGDRLRLLPNRRPLASVSASSSLLSRRCEVGPCQCANNSIAASRSKPSTCISQSTAPPCAPQPKQ